MGAASATFGEGELGATLNNNTNLGLAVPRWKVHNVALRATVGMRPEKTTWWLAVVVVEPCTVCVTITHRFARGGGRPVGRVVGLLAATPRDLYNNSHL